ncbi:uncharacterized protein LOC120392438 isoform X1 [Mauremys reevesii]|uniref:uncharacterized protein LOC120392438 isoform X1 n=2 Tax=Mauremys reevesii TaxID=260615 RepID=UPI00193F2A2A|nr:uncharacterized protein LOC120392438 isoform X1 [Mauremys reevesii]
MPSLGPVCSTVPVCDSWGDSQPVESMGRLPAPSIICFIIFIVPSIAAGLGVQQLPPTASVPAGGSVTLSCTFHSRNQTGTQVTWARGSREAVVLDPAHPFYQGRLAQSQRDQQGRAEATVTLSELMERDSGLYHCYITYPQGEQAKGTGTTLTVMGTAVAEIPAGCKRALVPNLGASGQKPAGLRVSQEPRSLHATAGENVTLSCTFQNRNGSRAKIIWLRGSAEDLELDSNHPFYRGRLRVSRMDEHRQGKATLTLAELQERDSGLYQCCIELDRGETGMGGGTELRVMGRHQSATGAPAGRELCRDSGPLVYRAVISLSLVVLFSLGIILSLRPWNGTGSTRVPPSLPVPNGYMASLCVLVTSPCPTPEPAASQHYASDPHVTSSCPTPEPATSQHYASDPHVTSSCPTPEPAASQHCVRDPHVTS